MAKENMTEQELRLEALKLALQTASIEGVLAKDARADAEVVRFAKRYWKFIKNDPIAEKDESASE